MTEKRARALHRAMWRWLAKHPRAPKSWWPGWGTSEEMDKVFDCEQCFACFVAHKDCDVCPIIKNAKCCDDPDSILQQYYELRGEFRPDPDKWADVCNRMADAWREIPEN